MTTASSSSAIFAGVEWRQVVSSGDGSERSSHAVKLRRTCTHGLELHSFIQTTCTTILDLHTLHSSTT